MERYRASVAIALAGLCMANHTIFGAVNVCDETSLRAAIAGGGHVTFNCDGTILLTSTLVVTQNVTLDASGRSVALSGNRVRIIEVTNGATLRLINLTLDRGLAEGTNGAIGQVGGRGAGAGVLLASNATLIATGCHFSNNRAIGGRGGDGHTGMGLPARPGGQAEGGAIFGGANLFLTNCMFTFNTATGGLGGVLPGAPEMESTGSGLGGCISMSDGVLAVANSLFTSNSATAGGAIYFAQRRGTVSNCRFVANTTRVSGGAIYHDADSLVVTDSGFFGNATSGHPALGGAIRQGFGELEVHRSVFEGNMATGAVVSTASAAGGALLVVGGQVSVSASTFRANWARGGDPSLGPGGNARGGAIYNSQGQTTVRNSTFVRNVAQAGAAGSSEPVAGGALVSVGGEVRIQYCTIVSNAVNNLAGARGAGLAHLSIFVPSSVHLENSIVSRNSSNGVFGENVHPATIGGGYNVSSDSTPVSPGTANNLDPKLGPLKDNGGPVSTMALLSGSPAINAANPAVCLPTDARGVARPQNGACDVGAFEQSFMTIELRPGISSIVSYFGVPNENYSIGYSFNLIDWEQANPQPSGAGPMSWVFPATASQVFYRVKLLP